MSELNIIIKKSISSLFIVKNSYKITLVKQIGSGSYGVVFLTDNKSIIAKILVLDEKPLPDLYETYLENDLIEEFIEKKYNFNQVFAYGHTQEKVKDKYFFKKDTKVFLMPFLVGINKYIDVVGRNFFSKEIYLIKYIKNLCKIHKEIEDNGYLNIDLKGSNVMINSDDKLVLIDYGLFIKYNPEEDFIPKEKYYCWCFEKIKQKHLHSFLICIFILEIIKSKKVYLLKTNADLVSLISSISSNYSLYFTTLIRNCLFIGMTIEELLLEIEELINMRMLDKRKDLPTLYSYLCEINDIKDYKKDAYY